VRFSCAASCRELPCGTSSSGTNPPWDGSSTGLGTWTVTGGSSSFPDRRGPAWQARRRVRFVWHGLSQLLHLIVHAHVLVSYACACARSILSMVLLSRDCFAIHVPCAGVSNCTPEPGPRLHASGALGAWLVTLMMSRYSYDLNRSAAVTVGQSNPDNADYAQS
jgi:hypothetical protein